MDFDIRVAFVILELDVKMGLVFLDQVHFQDQGFQFGINDDPFNIADILYQMAGSGMLLGTGMEVGTHPVAQVIGFPHINHLPELVFHQVTTGFLGDGFKNILDVFRDFHDKKIVSQAGFPPAEYPFGGGENSRVDYCIFPPLRKNILYADAFRNLFPGWVHYILWTCFPHLSCRVFPVFGLYPR